MEGPQVLVRIWREGIHMYVWCSCKQVQTTQKSVWLLVKLKTTTFHSTTPEHIPE